MKRAVAKAVASIPAHVEPELLRRATELLSSGAVNINEALAGWLKTEHGIKVTARDLRAFWPAYEARRQTETRRVIREHFAKTYDRDIAALKGLIERAGEDEQSAAVAGAPSLERRARSQRIRCEQLLKKYCRRAPPSAPVSSAKGGETHG
jgi:hypothetical protein